MSDSNEQATSDTDEGLPPAPPALADRTIVLVAPDAEDREVTVVDDGATVITVDGLAYQEISEGRFALGPA